MSVYAVASLLWLADSHAAAVRWRRLLRPHQTHIEPASGGQWACYSLVSDWFTRHETAVMRAADLAAANPDWRLSVVSVPVQEDAA